MKKVLMTVLAAAVGISALSGSASAASIKRVDKPQIQVLVDGKKMTFPDAKPYIDSSRHVLVPIRFISEKLGAKVGYSGEKTKTVSISMNGQEVSLTVGQSKAVVNGISKTFDTKAVAKNNRVFVPLRFVSEALGQSVNWDKEGSWVWIGKQEVPAIEDVTTLKDISGYKNYFKEKENLLKDGFGNTFSSVRIVSTAQLPVKFQYTTIYDIWKVTDGENYGIQIRYKGNDFQIFLLNKSFPRTRSGHVTKLSDGTKIAQYLLKDSVDGFVFGDKNWDKFSFSSFDYISFVSTYGEDSIHLLANPFK
ncbi:copper amine oxidase N-terminal domain-containing protein [Paenibacillus caui]|uniref:copper amine oxidase N-terminal domain-containing protein n=1 Tax=Paenibacillus caui TaxID=2873927 RepID=UPI001CAA2D6A|nr:copper amine oxidase N-terminal domain-containing protein [Paenibacillus caui]